ncbi:MAG: hypothetical protein J6X36_04820, partial [Lachnospiraceae bacterium]|nr:hypothetical protein [Lachnospiraceae bacterium]
MGFLKNLFSRKIEYDDDYFDYDSEYENPDWDRTDKREPIDLNDVNMMEDYVRNCLSQISDASKEMDRLTKEYDAVSCQLKDLEEVEEIPVKDKAKIETLANDIRRLRKEHDAYVLKESAMTDREYKLVESIEDDIAEAVKKLEEEEDLRKRIKQDLRRLDREKHAYTYRKSELEQGLANLRGTAFVALGAAAVLVVILILLQTILKLDVTLGYFGAAMLLSIALTFIFVKFKDDTLEKVRVSNTINGLILLENKVKIRYVNNKNLLDYLYTKYDVPDAWTLRDLYDRFEKERSARERFQKNEKIYQEQLAGLVRELRKFNISDPEVWIHQVDAIIDPKEMVETRHGLIMRRQKLRKQMEYNQDLASEASESVKHVIEEHPKYRDKI